MPGPAFLKTDVDVPTCFGPAAVAAHAAVTRAARLANPASDMPRAACRPSVT